MVLQKFTIFYFALAIIEIIADLLGIQWLVYLTKPLLMTSLIAFYVIEKNKNGGLNWQDKVVLTGFVFSLFGDIFLMFRLPSLFIFGLGSFLITHLCYIFVFSLKYKLSILARVAFLIYALVFIVFLKKYLPKELFLPVLVYAFTIATMGMRAAERQTNKKSYSMVLIGAILFIISDSFIAIDKFVNPLPAASLLIMGTYVVAQYLIAVYINYSKPI